MYTGVVCRGSWALGTACGKCQRCKDTNPASRSCAENTDLRKLDAAATQGVWGINDDLKGNFDDYEYLAVCGGAHVVMRHRKSHDDYAPSLADMRLFAALVNAYRAGELVEAPKESE